MILNFMSSLNRTDRRSPINSMRGISPKVFISGNELTFREQIGRGAFAIVFKGIFYSHHCVLIL
jgi:hypothetical protein